MEYRDEPGIIEPAGKNLGIKTAVATFSKHLFDELVLRSGAKRVYMLPGAVECPVYAFDCGGKSIAAYMSPIGAPAAACALEQAAACGVENFVVFGICGALTDIPTRKLVVPTHALRDEGTSRNYTPSGEFIELKNHKTVYGKLSSYGLECECGGCWTTDGFYRETRSAASEAVHKGCIAVDMECAALQAVCDYRGKNFYTFFITADSLAGEKWEPNYILDPSATDAETAAVAAAIRLAKEL